MNEPIFDRAQWGRFSSSNKDRCIVCNVKADVQVSMTATDLTAGRAGSLVNQKFLYCNTHGVLRFGDALGKLKAQQGKVD